MRIRTLDVDQDLDAVLKLWSTAGSGIQLSPSDQPDEIRKKLKRDPDLFIGAEEDGRLVGVVLGGFDGRRGIIYHLAVNPEERRRGIGLALMEEIERRLIKKACIRYYLLVTMDNEEAIAFYENMGCEILDLYVMGKTIV
jgi:ribosomal protein S18 acetylase RimI-like enzyme